jgi:hypothetical protein
MATRKTTKTRNWDEVEEYGEGNFQRIEPGAYVVQITQGTDLALKQYNEFLYDISEGDYAGYYNDEFYHDKDYAHRIIRSYKETALGFYKGFFRAVEKSNPGWQFNGDEHDAHQYEGKYVGIVLQEEEYESNQGEVKTRLNVARVLPADDVRDGNAPVLSLKKLPSSSVPPADVAKAPTVTVYDEDVPF